MSNFNLIELHRIQLGLAEEVKRICQKNSISFFLVDGSALGAVNMQDFLPWDDDLDIGMYWPDYQRFLEVCKTDLKSYYIMKDFSKDKNFGCCFGQLIDTRFELIQANNQNAKDMKGVFIDIHPFSNCSNNKLIRLLEYYRFKLYKLCLLQRRKYIKVKSMTTIVLMFLNKFYSDESLGKRIFKMRNRNKAKYALKIHGRHPEDYIVIDNLEKLENIVFSGISFPIQPDAQRMLNAVYGKFDKNKKEINRHNIISLNTCEEQKISS